MKIYNAEKSYKAKENSVVGVINLIDYVNPDYKIKDAWINVGGWQSWNPGFEVGPGKIQPSLKCHLIKGWNQYLVFPETKFKTSKNQVLGQFVCYLRWNDFYLVFASVGNVNNASWAVNGLAGRKIAGEASDFPGNEDFLPPVQFIFDRKKNQVLIEICDKNQTWEKGQIQAKIEIFTADSYFDCKNKLKEIFGSNHFEKIEGLGKNPGGWESWYNHYANINEKLILEDLAALNQSQNIITKGNFSSRIFQIDDGWEKNLGDWDFREDRFPQGLKNLAEKIENQSYIPGLWLAPFIIDSRSQTAKNHPDWLLRKENGRLLVAGFNPLWGKNGSFYCLDLSNTEVLNHLDRIMDKVINDWGFRYLKLDFLYAGMLYGKGQADDAAYKFYLRAVKKLTSRRQTKAGKPVFYLGCGLPFELSFNYFPLSRIGCDTYEKWENSLSKKLNWNGRNSAYLNLKDTLGHALWDKTIFANDPDVLFIRKENCWLSLAEKELIAKVDILFGSQLMYSDDPAKSSSEEEKLTGEILDFWEKYKDEEFGLRQTGTDFYEIFSKSGKYKGQINLGKEHYLLIEEK